MCDYSFFLNPMLNYLMENIHVLFLQATRDMHKSGLVLSTPSSQLMHCKFILVEGKTGVTVLLYSYDFFSFLSIHSLSRIGIVNLYDN